MNHHIIREIKAQYTLNRDFLSTDGLEEKKQNPGVSQVEYRNSFHKDPESYLKMDQLMDLFKEL